MQSYARGGTATGASARQSSRVAGTSRNSPKRYEVAMTRYGFDADAMSTEEPAGAGYERRKISVSWPQMSPTVRNASQPLRAASAMK